jgi:SAM-dependent methyltransferase
MTCSPRSSTTRLSAPPTACLTRPPARWGARPVRPGLDVYCGTGAGIPVLRSLSQGPVTGVHFSTGMLARARRAHLRAGWVRADVRALPFAGAFDLAVSFGALGHFLPAERPALFAGVHRAPRPGGISAFPVGAPLPATSR